MKYLIAVCCLILAACDNGGQTDLTLGGAADINVNDRVTECQIRQNGTSLIVRQTGLDSYTFIFDPSIVYADQYVTLTEADALRITPLSPDEQLIIDGLL